MPAQIAPPMPAAMVARIIPDGPPTCWATTSAHTDPTQNWPVPPMLKSPQRNANATAKPVSTSGVKSTSVATRLFSASSALTPSGLPGIRWNGQSKPAPTTRSL